MYGGKRIRAVPTVLAATDGDPSRQRTRGSWRNAALDASPAALLTRGGLEPAPGASRPGRSHGEHPFCVRRRTWRTNNQEDSRSCDDPWESQY